MLKTKVVIEMGSLVHSGFISGSNQKHSKIPEYAKDFKKEWLYIRGINRRCGEFKQIIEEQADTDSDFLEEVFSSSRARALDRDFKNVLKGQKMGKLQNISKLKFKLSVVKQIIDLKFEICFHMGHTFYDDFFINNDKFLDFFANFIIFTNNVNIKNEEDFENDLYKEYIRVDEESEIESLREIENEYLREILNEVLSGSESESESESD